MLFIRIIILLLLGFLLHKYHFLVKKIINLIINLLLYLLNNEILIQRLDLYQDRYKFEIIYKYNQHL